VDRLKEGLKKLKVDFFIIRDEINLYYLLGRKVEGFLLIPSDDEKLHLISDARYKFELEEMQNRDLKVHVFRN
jgi:Xaa-Pro aminopeptidase